ncbi:MAG: hypothetical protein SLAVMIC_00208 [uncultured marine phage]|uniref:Uncharacterized protein n=1 Tax=uncultured marine phage TaxID=707152 RepID=A0A8D9FQ15_9VIRU|nr:MAG: hypothetical protein SLAVMIC_00208 [uncultured marine phage]
MNHLKYIREYFSEQDGFYHGSNIKLNSLKLMPSTSGESKFLGDGIYISNSKDISDSYGKYTYSVILSEPLNSLQYFEEIDLNKFEEIRRIFQESENEDLNNIADDIEDDIRDNNLWWGKSLVSSLDRFGVSVKESLLLVGYNAIEAPINKLNQFMDRSDSERNICIIKDDILSIKSI